MIKKLVFTTVLILMSATLAYSQWFENQNPNEIGTQPTLITKSADSYGVQGHPFLTENFVPGELINSRGQKEEGVMMRYISYNDSLQVLIDGEEIILYSSMVYEFRFHDGNFVRHFRNGFKADDEDIEDHNFLEVLSETDDQLILMRHRKRFIESDFDPVFSTGSRYDTFRESGRLFVKNEDGGFERVRMRRRSILRLFDDHSSEIRSYARSEDLSFSDPHDVAQMVKRYEEIR